MKTVLGLSVTAAGIGWVLVDGTTAGGRAVDDDEFAVHDPDDLVPRCLAAVRGAHAIAASSGRAISSIGVCWSADIDDRSTALVSELRAAGYADVRSVRQVVPVSRAGSQAPTAERAERVGPCELIAALLADATDSDADLATFVDHEVTAAPTAGATPAYDAARAVVTDAVPAEPVGVSRGRRTVVPTRLSIPAWARPVSGARILTAVAVTAVIAVVAVGSQFVGSGTQQPGEAALAGRSSAATSEVVRPAPPRVQPLAAPDVAAAPVQAVTAPPVPMVQPLPAAVVEPAAVEPAAVAPAIVEPVAVVPAAVEPTVASLPLAAPDAPVLAAPVTIGEQTPPLPVDHLAPAAVPVDASAAPAGLPPVVGPAPGPPPAELPPPPPVDPMQAAIASLLPPPAP